MGNWNKTTIASFRLMS